MKKIIILLCTAMALQFLQAQNPMLDSAKNELYRINRVFDSSQYLGFNLDITYKSDSANVIVETDALSGNYVLNKKNLYYQMGGMEYVQTDSFSYSFYNDEKMMIVTKNMVEANSDVFPLRNFIDSMVHHYAGSYTISIDTAVEDIGEYIKRIVFTTNAVPGTNAYPPYSSFFIEYNDDSYYPSKFQFSYRETIQSENNGDTLPPIQPLQTLPYYEVIKTVTMVFSNYRGYVNTTIFDDAQYIIYNRQRKIYEPALKYREYKFITSGFENENEDAQYYREVPYNDN
jgi:hypothetical protein